MENGRSDWPQARIPAGVDHVLRSQREFSGAEVIRCALRATDVSKCRQLWFESLHCYEVLFRLIEISKACSRFALGMSVVSDIAPPHEMGKCVFYCVARYSPNHTESPGPLPLMDLG